MRRIQHSSSARIAAVCVVALTVCGDSGSGDTNDDSSTTSVSTSSTQTTAGSTTSDSTTGPATDTSAEATSDASSGPETTSAATGTETGADEVCMPDPADSACITCTKQMCCRALEACVAANQNCACVLDCAAELENPQDADLMMCASNCGVGHEAMAQLLAVLDCEEMTCEACSGGGGTGTTTTSGG